MTNPTQNSRHSVNYSWEDLVDSLTNKIILSIFKEKHPDIVQNVESLVKDYLDKKNRD